MFQCRKPYNRKEIYTFLKAQKNFLDWNHEVFHKRVWMMTEWTIEIRYLTLDALRCQTIQLIQNSNSQVHSIKRKKVIERWQNIQFCQLNISLLILMTASSMSKSMCNWQFKHKFKFYLYQCYTKLRLLVSVNLSCSRY